MVLQSILEKHFNRFFLDQKSVFLDECLSELDIISLIPEKRFLLFGEFSNGLDLSVDINYAKRIIQATILNTTNPEFIGRSAVFCLTDTDDIDFDDAFVSDYIKKVNETLLNYFTKEIRIKEIGDLFQFKSFHAIETNQIKGTENVFNIEGWTLFFENSLKHFYPSFTFLKKKKEILFLRDVDEKISFGFLLNIKEYEREFKKYACPDIPLMQNVILLKETNERIVSDNDFQHPFFHDIVSLRMYILRDYIKKQGPGFEILPIFQQTKTQNGHFSLSLDEKLGLRYKQYAYFKIAINSKVKNMYFNTLEVVLKKISNEFL